MTGVQTCALPISVIREKVRLAKNRFFKLSPDCESERFTGRSILQELSPEKSARNGQSSTGVLFWAVQYCSGQDFYDGGGGDLSEPGDFESYQTREMRRAIRLFEER